MELEPHLFLFELLTLEAQLCAEPAASNGTVLFLKDGMLAVIRTAIAAMEELEQANLRRD